VRGQRLQSGGSPFMELQSGILAGSPQWPIVPEPQ
jgi:hypothetical protein